MAKVTSKLQVTVPQKIAKQYGIRPGDDIEWIPAGDAIRVVAARTASGQSTQSERQERLRLFDLATERQRQRDVKRPQAPVRERGWKREDLYKRGRTD